MRLCCSICGNHAYARLLEVARPLIRRFHSTCQTPSGHQVAPAHPYVSVGTQQAFVVSISTGGVGFECAEGVFPAEILNFLLQPNTIYLLSSSHSSIRTGELLVCRAHFGLCSDAGMIDWTLAPTHRRGDLATGNFKNAHVRMISE